MHPSAVPLAAQFRLHTQLVLNCLDGLDDTLATRRLTPGTNSIAFLAAHLVESRHFIASLIGAPLPSPLSPAFARARSLDDAGPLPAIRALVEAWESVSAHLAVLVERLDTPALKGASQRLPGTDGSLLEGLAFLAHHEAYHLGQMALLRRQLGQSAMTYAMPPREAGRQGA